MATTSLGRSISRQLLRNRVSIGIISNITQAASVLMDKIVMATVLICVARKWIVLAASGATRPYA